MKKKQTHDPTSGADTAAYAARLRRRLRRSPRARASYLNAALHVAPLVDEEPFLASLWGLVQAHGGKERVADLSGIPVEKLEQAIDDAGFDLIVHILKFFDLKLCITRPSPSVVALAAEIRASHHLDASRYDAGNP